MDVAGHFGENLARCRKHADLSQEELGFRASLHRTQIGILESGRRLPRIDTLVKLAGALEISPCDLLEGIVWHPGTASIGRFGSMPENEDAARRQAGRGSPTRSA